MVNSPTLCRSEIKSNLIHTVFYLTQIPLNDGVSDFLVFESKLLAVAVASGEGISPADCGDVATVAGTIGGEAGSVFDFSICFCDF